MELYIDNQRVDTDAGSEISISLSVASATEPQKGRTGYTRTLRLPSTPLNDSILGYAAEIHARDGFNSADHVGRVEHEGAVLFEGPLILSRAERSAGTGFYDVHIIGASKEWVRRASATMLPATDVAYSKTLNGSNILASWSDSSPVRFLPVAREKYEADFSSGGVIPAMKILSSDDYHPFIHAGTLLNAIFAGSGYSIESDFTAGPAFASLYISGNYPTRDVSILKANMDFLARRLAPRTAVANSTGRVYADPYQISFTVGNIVDTAEQAVGADGVSYDDVFTNNGCFRMDDERIAFIPTSAVSVGFQFHLRYVTDCRMKSRSEMTGFDRIYLGEQSARRFTLANPYPDRRTSLRPSHTYSLAVFEHAAGWQYQLRYTQHTATGSSTVSSPVISTRFSSVTMGEALSVADPVLYYRTSTRGSWVAYTGDWALYDGFVGETGTLDVSLTIRTAPENITPGQPKFFDTIYFGGAEPGMSITVSEKCRVRPVFYAQPTEGSALSFADVCAHQATQMDFINALRQMFNLRFHTDNRAKTVRIEPAGTFYSEDRVVDLTDRVDLGRPVTVEELGGDLSRTMAWCYREGDGASGRLNRSVGGEFGYWSASIENRAAADGVSVWKNAMFTPSVSAAGLYRGAPSASLVQAGDISADTLERTEDLNFEPKIVRYDGLAALPATESWGWPSVQSELYPHIAFHAPDRGYSLCFEDRDGCTGLRSHYGREVKLWNEARRVTLWLALSPADIESLSFPTGSGVDFQTLLRITLGGEEGLYRLEEVCDYLPSAPSTKCILIKHIP